MVLMLLFFSSPLLLGIWRTFDGEGTKLLSIVYVFFMWSSILLGGLTIIGSYYSCFGQ